MCLPHTELRDKHTCICRETQTEVQQHLFLNGLVDTVALIISSHQSVGDLGGESQRVNNKWQEEGMKAARTRVLPPRAVSKQTKNHSHNLSTDEESVSALFAKYVGRRVVCIFQTYNLWYVLVLRNIIQLHFEDAI